MDDKKIMESKPLEKDRMIYFLDDVIIRSLKIGVGSKYNRFLSALENCDDDDGRTNELGEFAINLNAYHLVQINHEGLSFLAKMLTKKNKKKTIASHYIHSDLATLVGYSQANKCTFKATSVSFYKTFMTG